ncbi:HD domain-containing phosphohydrolase [Maridesulfovibrio sp.]|uniref:HD domain-containing phosphohydrolase n=1 Tax=Maridesulfovibrio sp. TaxID=2795000 RepID=UPI0029F5B4E0|nr:HD domain-containing phosphohydrolase [Maridesulfovibrio sp.]
MNRKLSIATLISWLLAGTCLLTAATILYIVKGHSDEAAIESAEEYFAEVTGKAAAKLDTFIEPVAKIADVAGATLCSDTHGEDGSKYCRRLEPLKAILDANFYLMSAYIGYENGSFYQVIAPRGWQLLEDHYETPPGCAYIERFVSADEQGKKNQHWRFFDSSMHLLAERSDYSEYDPRRRPWFRQAMLSCDSTYTTPYIFSSSRVPGITCARTLQDGSGVFGLDISLKQLGSLLASQHISSNGRLWIVDYDNHVVAYSGKGRVLDYRHDFALHTAYSFPDKAVESVARIVPFPEGNQISSSVFSDSQGRDYMASLTPLHTGSGLHLVIAAAAPLSDVTDHLSMMPAHILYSSTALLIAISLLAIYIGNSVKRSFNFLLREAGKIQELDFSASPPLESRIKELNTLGKSGQLMKETLRDKTAMLHATHSKLEKLVQCGLALSSEKDDEKLIELIFDSARDFVEADGGVIYLVEDNKLAVELLSIEASNIMLGGLSGNPAPRVIISPDLLDFISEDSVLREACEVMTSREIRFIENKDLSLFPTGLEAELKRGQIQSMITAPIITRSDEVLGVIQLFNPVKGVGTEDGMEELLGSLLAQVAVGLENHNLVKSLEELFDAFIKVIAAAIDAKSPYTGGHCTRVPQLAEMLAVAVHETNSGPLKDFRVGSDDEWRQLWIAGWLHDCGKVITPEYVVDKATKLETIYDRIHEVRMRFEVLRRDAEIDYYRKLTQGGDEDVLRVELQGEIRKLEKDFAFIAESNIGSEFMDVERRERVSRIASRKWMRYFDNRMGVGHMELERMGPPSDSTLPVEEKLLDDKPEHIIPRTKSYEHIKDARCNPIDVPANDYNRGEVYNLCVSRGTLTDEERFKINEHMLNGLEMLSNIPFPKHLERVTEIATGHHETLTGTGYPLKKDENSLSIETRILAVADIFEALTASDRPYKKAKKISEALKIMSFMRDDRHIDEDVFDVFLLKGVHLDYARKFLFPDQCDVDDVSEYLSRK